MEISSAQCDTDFKSILQFVQKGIGVRVGVERKFELSF